jgi:hypothetical protein
MTMMLALLSFAALTVFASVILLAWVDPAPQRVEAAE